MPQYSFFIWNKRSRVKYPTTFDLPDVEAARIIAIKIVRTFIAVVPHWKSLPPEQRVGFVVEVDNDAGQTELSIPFEEAEERKP